MRNITITGFIALIPLLPCSTLGQGTFLLQNFDAGINAPVFDAQGFPLSGSSYFAELYGDFAPDSLSPAMPRTAVPFLTGIAAGYFHSPYYVLIPSVPGNGLAWLRVRAWDVRLGATYEDVLSLGLGGYGESQLFQATGGCIECMPPVGPRPLIGLQSFSLLPVVPEPQTVLIFLLGLPLLLWHRRRQCNKPNHIGAPSL